VPASRSPALARTRHECEDVTPVETAPDDQLGEGRLAVRQRPGIVEDGDQAGQDESRVDFLPKALSPRFHFFSGECGCDRPAPVPAPAYREHVWISSFVPGLNSNFPSTIRSQAGTRAVIGSPPAAAFFRIVHAADSRTLPRRLGVSAW
jgi:hypothetical protein